MCDNEWAIFSLHVFLDREHQLVSPKNRAKIYPQETRMEWRFSGRTFISTNRWTIWKLNNRTPLDYNSHTTM